MSEESPFLTAEWNDLIMANYVVHADLLTPYIPKGTVLDDYHGQVFVSLIGFMFEKTRLLGFKIPFHVNFEEVNLRFYVKYLDQGIWKRGAVFIKEIVPKLAISLVANTLYREKYSTMPMKHYKKQTIDEIELGYFWKYKETWNSIEAVTSTKARVMEAGSEEEFIAEHYWGYSQYNINTTYEYAVGHPSWLIYDVKSYHINCDFEGLYGAKFAFLKDRKPNSVFVAQGSPIRIMNKNVIKF